MPSPCLSARFAPAAEVERRPDETANRTRLNEAANVRIHRPTTVCLSYHCKLSGGHHPPPPAIG